MSQVDLERYQLIGMVDLASIRHQRIQRFLYIVQTNDSSRTSLHVTQNGNRQASRATTQVHDYACGRNAPHMANEEFIRLSQPRPNFSNAMGFKVYSMVFAVGVNRTGT